LLSENSAEKGKSKAQERNTSERVSFPGSIPLSIQRSLESTLDHKINEDASDLFEYFDAPVSELNVPVVKTPTPSLDSSSVSSELYTSSASTISPPTTPGVSASKSDSASRSAKKAFSWLWGSDDDIEKKVQHKGTKKKNSDTLSPTSPKQLFKKSPPGSKVSLLENEDNASLETTKLKSKDKPKKISLFFLSKEKNKTKKSKTSKVNQKEKMYLRQPETLYDAHFPLCDPCDLPPHIEQQLYRLSHQKLANPRRPLGQQVIISNMMLAYLRVVNPNFRAPQSQSKPQNNTNDKKELPRPRSPHLISKERYKHGRHLPVDSSDEDDDISFSDSDSDDESLISVGLRSSS